MRGNHENLAIAWHAGALDMVHYVQNGGAWNFCNPPETQAEIAQAFSVMPYGIEVSMADGSKIGIVHADFLHLDWNAFWQEAGDLIDFDNTDEANTLVWGRKRIKNKLNAPVTGISHIYCGHTPVDQITTLGNITFIDNAAWHEEMQNKAFNIIAL